MARNFNPEIANAVRDFLDKDNWRYSFDSENGFFRFGVNMSGKMKHIQYLILINELDYNVYAISPLAADRDEPERMQQMAEFICRANYGLKDGNFEMNFNDGEIRYKCYMNCNGGIPAREMVENSILCPAAMFRRFSRGFFLILFNDMSAADAIKLCEGTPNVPVNDRRGEEDTSSHLMKLLQRLRERRESAENEDEDSEDDRSKASGE